MVMVEHLAAPSNTQNYIKSLTYIAGYLATADFVLLIRLLAICSYMHGHATLVTNTPCMNTCIDI